MSFHSRIYMNDLNLFAAISAAKTVWLYTLFDLPVVTPKQRKAANRFRKSLLKDGFSMFQYSVYIRHCASKEQADVHINRVKMMTPPEGMVTILQVTDKQCGQMVTMYGAKSKPSPPAPVQLELF